MPWRALQRQRACDRRKNLLFHPRVDRCYIDLGKRRCFNLFNLYLSVHLSDHTLLMDGPDTSGVCQLRDKPCDKGRYI